MGEQKMTEIELVKQEIKMLQSKLEFLEELEKTARTPIAEGYKKVFGTYPNVGENSTDFDIQSWNIFQYAWEQSRLFFEEQSKDVGVPECPDEPEYYDEVEWDEKDNPKPMDEVVNRLVKKYEAQKLFNRLVDELGYDFDACNDVVDLVEDWLPKEQSAAGSQNVYVECSVEGFNDCLTKIKSKLR